MDRVRWSALLMGWGKEPGPRYAQLAGALRDCIRDGQLRAGDALPAERRLAELLHLSRSTVVTAYDTLAGEGWVTRRQGSGTHVSPTAPRQAALLALRSPVPASTLSGEGQADLLDLTIAVPTLTPAHRVRLEQASAGAFADSAYYPLGLPELRVFLAGLYTREGLPTTPEQVIVTSGAQQAITLIAQTFLGRGDLALLETPTYFGAIDAFRAAGAELRGLRLGPEGVSPDSLHAALPLGPRLVFLTPTFQNPTGTVIPPRMRERLAALVTDAGLPTIEDDTLIDLGFGGTTAPRLSTFAPQGTVINVGSLSKLFWAGLRLGWLRAPTSLLPALVQAKTLADFGSALPSQVIALNLLRDLDTLREERRETVITARDTLVDLLRKHLPEWTFTPPPGGQFLWVQLPTRNATAFTHFAYRFGVRLFPGASMGTGELPDTSLRLPFTLPPEQLPEAVARLRAAWETFRERGPGERLA
ncbi:PLP-dependent aminotransferase family protein [Deinococcus hopiensis]|uniref:DNA-binding transcriptional regulator, MocR family, contains an aminotransferase domain n=1 Tax=Deinococcus hopiensis KR-140 TaxID=695939 RepID=A0A1W1V5X8_9DEIO|nr:PLP-dependent aminotransferase family protein [Deinococcus hopiensis]SMB88461.1 DNA-binding transcriptional regulator, MocR family, contains an aminotransferase domain [Deinococcus hopiensis KR-140]